MPSPFPGMNPYLEHPDVWHGFHGYFCPELAKAVVAELPARYMVRMDENVYLHELSADERRLFGRPDVGVFDRSGTTRGHAPNGSASAVAPAYAQLPAVDLERLPFIEIRDIRSRRLVTVIELLSPANKRPGTDRDAYLTKRARLMHETVNLVEIDLLRGWPRMPMDGAPTCDYMVTVARPEEWPRVGVWPIGLRDPLPEIPIPLTAPDPDVRVALQPLLHAIYDAGGYERFVYDGEPEPPLSAADAEWARRLVPAGH